MFGESLVYITSTRETKKEVSPDRVHQQIRAYFSFLVSNIFKPLLSSMLKPLNQIYVNYLSSGWLHYSLFVFIFYTISGTTFKRRNVRSWKDIFMENDTVITRFWNITGIGMIYINPVWSRWTGRTVARIKTRCAFPGYSVWTARGGGFIILLQCIISWAFL